MKTLKTMALIGASALAVSAVSTAAAQAQPWGGYDRGYERHHEGAYVDARMTPQYIDRLNARLTAEARAGEISWNAAYHMGQDLRAVRGLAWKAQTGRASPWELRRLNETVARVEAQSSRYAMDDRSRHYGRYDRR